jgi:DNA invertase Pin-like site-specific DNA recombinase
MGGTKTVSLCPECHGKVHGRDMVRMARLQRIGIDIAKGKGLFKGRKPGTTKSEPKRAKELRAKGLKVSEIAQALGTTKRTVQRYMKTTKGNCL